MKTVSALTLLLFCTALPGFAQKKSMTYPQLISTRYATGATLPADFQRPAATFDFVEKSKLPAGAVIRSAAQGSNHSLWIVTDKGVFRSQGDKYIPLRLPRSYKAMQPVIDADARIMFVTRDKQGHIWLATTGGAYVTDGADWWQAIDRHDGMPYDILTCLHLAANGDVWGGTPEGVWRLRKGKFRYFWGKRWLPGNKVSAIWTDAAGRAWVETDGGTACIEEKPMTLAEKAAHYDQITQERHNRRGFIGDISLKVPGDPSQGYQFHADDNDGLWTGYYVAAMALRYAVTKDAAARKEAQQSMNAMLDLERLTGIPGFPSRSNITDDEIKAGVTGYSPNEIVGIPGETAKLWFRSPIQKDLWCKGDTSSDEINGHFLAWYTYFEYVADAAEKERITATVRRTMDYIIKNDYTLIGHTGHPTRWGIWGPQFLNDDPYRFGERGLNSLEILSYLKVANHITGDAKYQKAFDDLVEKHHYLLNTLVIRRGVLGNWWDLNHSDDQLSYVVYYPLLMLERDPERRRILIESVARTWEPSVSGEQTLKIEHSSFYNFAYGAMTGNLCAPEAAIEDLQDWPWELIEWSVKNSQRHDVQFKQHPGNDGRNFNQLTRVLPSSERLLKRWNDSPWTADGNKEGRSERDGSTWLIAYWLGVFHGYIDKNQ